MMEKRTLREISTFIRTGKTPPTSQTKYFEGEVNWYTPGDLDLGKYLAKSRRTLTQLAIDDKKAVVFPKDTLLIGCIGDIGKIGITTDLCSSNQQLTGLYPNEKADVSYLYYWFKGNKKTLESTSNNAVVPILNNRTLETIKIPLPPLPQQQKIANILDAADALRQKDKALLAKYDELTQALFLDMFGDPVSNPKGFSINRLEEFYLSKKEGTKCGPFGGALKKEEFVEKGIPVWNMDNITKKGELVSKMNLWITNEKFNILNSYAVINGDIIISRAGTVGKMCVVNTTFENSIISTNLIRLRLNNNLLLPMYFVLLMTYFKEKIGRLQTGSDGAFSHMNTGVLNDLKFPYPPIELQNQFAERVQAIEQQKSIAQRSLEKSEALFNSLLQKAFKGELV
jgi:type I restriction enzyme S subunit